MDFYVIYDVTFPECDYNGHDNHAKHYAPPNEELWAGGEEEESDYDYIAKEEIESGMHGVKPGKRCTKWPNCGYDCRRCYQWAERYPASRYSRWINLGSCKWVTKEPISRKDFDQFVRDQCLTANSTKTLGSLTKYDWLPAISFRGDEDSIVTCYVTPVLRKERLMTEDNWDRIESAMQSVYGNGR